MNVVTAPEGVRKVRALYESLRGDVAYLRKAPPAEPELSATIATVLAGEARLLDTRAFDRWQPTAAEGGMDETEYEG